jgi:hypothetical protein
MRVLNAETEGGEIDAFVGLVGPALWQSRLRQIAHEGTSGPRAARAALQRHAVEFAIEKLRRDSPSRVSAVERRIAAFAGEVVALAERLTSGGRARFLARLRAGLEGPETLVPVLHLLRVAAVQRARGFAVSFAGLEDDAPFDLLLQREGIAVELACDTVSAEEGRNLHRGAWFRLMDRIDPELQTWLAAHPGRYLLKMTLSQGLKDGLSGLDGADALALLHQRITALLQDRSRAHQDEAMVLRLDPLLLAAAQADELGLMSHLRREFGPEAHLAVTAAGGGVFVLAARAGREDAVAVAVRRRMEAVVPQRLTGERPGILAMLIEDTDRAEWRGLRERMELEGEARQFLTQPAARHVVAVTCTSRLELFGLEGPDGAPDGELRFRNPAHPAAREPALAPAVQSSV